jgi:hypothetical protein
MELEIVWTSPENTAIESTLIQSTFPQIISHNSATILSLCSPSCHFQLYVCHLTVSIVNGARPAHLNLPHFYATTEIFRLETLEDFRAMNIEITVTKKKYTSA